MQFINIFMLFGLLAVSIPIIIQLLTRKNPRRIPWGAWLFLEKTMRKRKRKMLLEDILLLACRCLALGLLALGFARPFVRPDSSVPWAITLPLLLVSITAIAVSFALWRHPKQRKLMLWGGSALFALAIATIVFERYLDLKRFGLGATKDIVIIVDGSASMTILNDGKSNFERAIEEAKRYVELAPRNTSFAVIVGGPVPQVMNPVPIADRRIVMNTLDRLHPVNGTMRIGANLTAAAVTLAAGHNAVKQIVIVGDGQTVGWQLTDVARWKSVAKAFAALKTHPIISWRTLSLPASIRNLAIESVKPARQVVGTDREVSFAVTLVNAGGEAVTPKGLTFTAEGHEYRAHGLGQLQPSESRVFKFSHRFSTPGGTVVTAKVDAGDDLPADDVYRYAMPVIDALQVLVVDGGSGVRRDRSATYISTALRPELQALTNTQQPIADAAPTATRNAYLVKTTVEDAVAAGSRTTFAGYSAVILAGVRRFSDQTLTNLADFVRSGGGLFVLPHAGTDVASLNDWQVDGAPVLPAPLGSWKTNDKAIETESMVEMLERFRTGTDLGTVVPERVMSFGDGWTADTTCLARLAGGTPLILRRTFGRGTIMLAGVDFDPASGLVTKRSFLPLVHELAYALARPAAVDLDVRPAETLSLLIASGNAGGAAANEPGLVGYYFPQPDFKGKPRVRIDRSFHLSWNNDSPFKDGGFPSDNFSVRWRGVFSVPTSGKYRFMLNADDRATLKIGGSERKNHTNYHFEQGKFYPIEIDYQEGSGGAAMHFHWAGGPNGEQGSVSSKYLRTYAEGVGGAGEVVAVTDPHGETFYAEVAPADDGLYLRIPRSVVPGVYEVSEISESLASGLVGVVAADGRMRFSVSSGVEESTMTAITTSDLSKLASYVQISQAIKEEDVVKSICGESFGKEVWRILAIIAFLFLVLEPLISRWIAINRRTGDVIDTEGSWIRT